jgi:hypothetical protein
MAKKAPEEPGQGESLQNVKNATKIAIPTFVGIVKLHNGISLIVVFAFKTPTIYHSKYQKATSS